MRLSQIWKRFGNRALAVVLAGAIGAFAGALASSGALPAADGAPAAAVKAAPAPAPAPAPAAQPTAQQRLDQLNKLAAGGYITPEEYKVMELEKPAGCTSCHKEKQAL